MGKASRRWAAGVVGCTPLSHAAAAGVEVLTSAGRPPTNKGGLKVKLESGPDGMKVSPEGEVTWAVPADFEGPAPEVLVSIGDASGRQTFHTFAVAVAAR